MKRNITKTVEILPLYRDDAPPLAIYFKRHSDIAVPPTKANPYATGYDLYIVRVTKVIDDNTIMYDTDISVQPPEGYYTEVVPRSSIINTGWMLANSVGIIDEDYRGTIKVVLRRLEGAKYLELPLRIAQLIPRRRETIQMIESDTLTETERGEGGFGSTNK